MGFIFLLEVTHGCESVTLRFYPKFEVAIYDLKRHVSQYLKHFIRQYQHGGNMADNIRMSDYPYLKKYRIPTQIELTDKLLELCGALRAGPVSIINSITRELIGECPPALRSSFSHG